MGVGRAVLMTGVVVDGWALGGAAAYRGVGTYARHVVAGLCDAPGLEVSVLAEPTSPVPDGARQVAIRRHAPGRWRALEHDVRLPLDLRRVPGDVVFEPAPDPPRRSTRPIVQTLHDVIPLVFPDDALRAERRRWTRWASRYRGAAAVIAVSRFSADEGIRRLGVDPARVHVVHHGVGPEFSPGGARRVAELPYLVAVGEFSARKGFAEAFAAIAGLAEAGYPHRLVVAGRIAPWVEPDLERLRSASPRPDRIDLLGFVDDLPGLYRGASAFVGASRYEGFGLPAVEAMACGTPVVAFDNSATSEVVADGGLLVSDGDVGALVDGLRSVLDDDHRRADVAAAGVARAATFSWARCVSEHVDVLRAVAS